MEMQQGLQSNASQAMGNLSKEDQDTVIMVKSSINKILMDADCSLIPVTMIAGNHVTQAVEIIKNKQRRIINP
jgi:hypothetical protein